MKRVVWSPKYNVFAASGVGSFEPRTLADAYVRALEMYATGMPLHLYMYDNIDSQGIVISDGDIDPTAISSSTILLDTSTWPDIWGLFVAYGEMMR